MMIISGGQTGVDRAALDVAAELGLPAGGWCPRGRAAEDGPIHSDYPLRETLSESPSQRTLWNVFDSDATLLIARGELDGGSRLTVEAAERFGRPLLVVDPDDAGSAAAWLVSLAAHSVLNVAGPRASEWAGAYSSSRALLHALLPEMRAGPELPDPSRHVLITGGDGYLGRHLLGAAPPGWTVDRTTRRGGGGARVHQIELSDAGAVGTLLSDLQPSVVIHTAYGAADGDRDIVAATRNVAAACESIGARLIHISSDMVLNGESAPFPESAEPAPVHEYGRWKSSAEALVRDHLPGAAIVRVSLLTRLHPPDPRTEWVLEGVRGEAVRELYDDELRTPTLVEDASRQIWEIAQLGEAAAGVWHLANPEAVSRFSLGCLIAAAYDMAAGALVPSSGRDAPGPRPRDLRLLTGRADRSLPTRSRGLGELVSECRKHTRFNRIEPNQ